MTYNSIVKSLSTMVDQLVKHKENQRAGILMNDGRISEIQGQSYDMSVEADRAGKTTSILRDIIE